MIPLPPVKIPGRPNTESVPDDVLHRLGLSIIQTSLPKFPSLELRSAGGSRHDRMTFTSQLILNDLPFNLKPGHKMVIHVQGVDHLGHGKEDDEHVVDSDKPVTRP